MISSFVVSGQPKESVSDNIRRQEETVTGRFGERVPAAAANKLSRLERE